MSVARKFTSLIMILSFCVENAGPSYALRPMATEISSGMGVSKPSINQKVLFDKRFTFSPMPNGRKRTMRRIRNAIWAWVRKLDSPWINIDNRSVEPEELVIEVGLDDLVVFGNLDRKDFGYILLFESLFYNSLDAVAIRWHQEGRRKDYKGVIKIRMFRRDNELIIEVIDNGVGIERRILEELFLEELKSEKSNYPEDLKLTGRVGIDIFNFYARLLIAELGGNIVIDAFHPKSKANKLTYRSDSDIKIRKSRRKEQGTSIRFTLPGFFAKGTEPDLSFGQSLPVIGKADKKSVLDEGIATAFYAIDAAA